MADSRKTTGALLLLPAITIGGHGLLYTVGCLMVALVGLGFGGLSVAGMMAEGATDALPGLVIFGGMATVGVLIMAAFALFHLVLGAVTLWVSVSAIRGRSGSGAMIVTSAVSCVFCGGWTLLALLAFNPLFVLWIASAILSLIAGIMAVMESK